MGDCTPSAREVRLTRQEQAALDRTVSEINDGYFFEAHETLEQTWTACRERHRVFLQAVIHVAVGAYHGSRGNRLGLERQFVKARRKLAGFLPACAGIDTATLAATLDRLIAESRTAGDGAVQIPLPLVRKSANRAGAVPRESG